jgi:UDP-3-O-[3-hydroxymyristoyl] glucosamine N-acyltransferase
MKTTLSDLAARLGCRLAGDGSVTVSAVSSLRSANSASLVFVDDPRHLAAALGSGAAAVITGQFETGEFAAGKSVTGESAAGQSARQGQSRKPLLIAEQPRLAFARAAKFLARTTAHARGIHPSAMVAISTINDDVDIGPRAIVGERVTIGAGTTIGAACVIGDNVEIGADCRIDANVIIYPGAKLGNRVVVQSGAVLGSDGFGYVRDEETGRYEQFPQVGRLVIEDDVEIGANSTVDRGALDETRIRRGTKIDNLVHVGHNVLIGEDVVIAAQTGVSGSSVIENRVIVGGQVGIADHVRIEEGAILGAQSGIPTKKVIRGKGVVFWGTPARPIREYLKELAFLSKAVKDKA